MTDQPPVRCACSSSTTTRSSARASSRCSTAATGFQVVAEAGTVAEAIEQARRFQPDIVVMDVRLPDGSGIEACREIRAELPATRVVMLTSYPDEEAVLSAIVAGRVGLSPQADPRPRPRRGAREPSAAASRCSTRR